MEVFLLFNRVGMSGLCCHATMQSLAMIPAVIPSRRGKWRNDVLQVANTSNSNTLLVMNRIKNEVW